MSACLLLGALACAPGRGRPAAAPDLARPRVAENEVRALLLLLVERQAYERVTVEQALRGGPELREELAVTLGRIHGDRPAEAAPEQKSESERRQSAAGRPAAVAGAAEGRQVLAGLLLDEVPAVRRAAAFSLGLRGDPAAQPALLQAVGGGDRETGMLAVEALGRLGATIADVAEQLLPLPEEERWRRLLPYLFLFKEPAVVPLATLGLEQKDQALRRAAAYALARDPLPAAAPRLRALLGDADPLLRSWSARALGRLGTSGGEEMAVLLPLLSDPAAGPAIQALRAAAALIAARQAAPAAAWKPRLLELLADPRPALRTTALEVAGAWLPDPQLEQALAARLPRPGAGPGADPAAAAPPQLPAGPPGAAPPPSRSSAAVPAAVEQGLALVALARGRAPRAAALAEAAAGAADPWLRARSAEAAGVLGQPGLLARLAADPSPLVRETALGARLEAAAVAEVGPQNEGSAASAQGQGSASAIAAAALDDPDEGVRTTACEWLAAHPVVPLAALARELAVALQDSSIESGLGAVKALAARGEAQALERGAIVALLEKVSGDRRQALRRAAATGLARLGRPVPPGQPAAAVRGLEVYRQIVERTRRPRTVEIRTSRGSLRARLDCPRAPLTCLNFLELASQGFYDGLLFHRVVPDFVVQGGDPRGDGFGGPGYVIHDEIDRLRYARGVLGMALAGADTGGSQFFITLAPQPHLDGRYTAFGEVVEGGELLDSIEVGDRIERIVALD